MSIRHVRVPRYTQPVIVVLAVIAGFASADGWLLVAGLLAAWFIDAEPWEPFDERKSDDAPR